ncbi:helix-turn-helix domain-containing protein [Nitrospirillum amazonense]|uniref:helix-turn-helix domain-containing protein n=1 Tax=Nitrospirillum amazonense TaxID=28077 RepID=UPI002412BC26|nr:helix-turn-helix transcriptional regulator [Nitrospirillum amazonense]MDG3439562.1 helix-turn-helix transcriptional regulator [Nitrospirillum amazonense]
MRIKAIRNRRGLSQEALAALIDRSPDAISNLERGVSLPGYDTLDLLAQGLGVPLAEFFVDEKGDDPRRAEAMARLNDAARQLDNKMLATAAAIVELLAAGPGKQA